MCHVSVIDFFIRHAEKNEFENKRILEIGSRNINGSVRPLIERFLNPYEYIGIDIFEGEYVDIVLPAEKVEDYFGKESFDVVISTEVLEHVRDWRRVVSNMKNVLKRGGFIYITTRSKGFPLHDYPHDYWRYEVEDFKIIFSDLDIIVIEEDKEAPGVFLKARKPERYNGSVDLSNVALYSVLKGKRINYIPDDDGLSVVQRLKFKAFNSPLKGLISVLLPEKVKNSLKRRLL